MNVSNCYGVDFYIGVDLYIRILGNVYNKLEWSLNCFQVFQTLHNGLNHSNPSMHGKLNIQTLLKPSILFMVYWKG